MRCHLRWQMMRQRQLRKAMDESHMGHLSRFRFIFSRSQIASSNDREMDVIVDINVFYSDPQTCWIPTDITSRKLKIAHHCVTSSSVDNVNSKLSHQHDYWWTVPETSLDCLGSRALRALLSNTEMCSNFETSVDTPAEGASFSIEELLYALNMMTGTSGITRFTRRVASKPFILGIEKSRRIMSGCNS